MEVGNTFKIKEWFNSKVLYPRYLSILLWSSVIQAVIISISVTFSHFLCQAPSDILFNFGQIFKFCNFTSLLFLLLLTICLLALHLWNIKTVPFIASSLWVRVMSWTNVEQNLYIMFITLIYVIYGNCLAKMSGFDEATLQKTEDDRKCISEKSLAMTVFYIYLGIVTSVSYFRFHRNCLKFESVVLLKVYSIKLKLKEELKNSLKITTLHLLKFLAIYLTLGFATKLLLHSVYDISFCNERFILFASIQELVSFKFLLIAFVTGYASLMLWNVIFILSQVFLTERCEFSLDVTRNLDQHRQLTEALKQDKHSLMRHLALLDLKHFSESSEKKRSCIFSVSLPGGHPHIWNTVSNENLNSISSFTSSLHDVLIGKPSYMLDNLNGKQKERLQESVLEKTPLRFRNIAENCNLQKPFNSYPTNSNSTLYFNNILKKTIFLIKKFKVALPIPRSFVQFLTDESMEKNLENTFCKCQPIIWSIQALTSIVVASYHEDKYGVVQWSLASILSTLLELQMVLEKIVRPKRNGIDPSIWQIQQSLKAAVNNSLYRIVSVFYTNLNYLELSEDKIKRLKCFKI